MLNDGSQGYTLDQGNLIVVANDIALSKQKVVVMHEILHAMRMIFENGLPEKDSEYEKWEHYFIGIYENALLMFMRDNPELLDWLIAE
jgi:Mlc titration factor MtfA (ptsG expression regulator)